MEATCLKSRYLKAVNQTSKRTKSALFSCVDEYTFITICKAGFIFRIQIPQQSRACGIPSSHTWFHPTPGQASCTWTSQPGVQALFTPSTLSPPLHQEGGCPGEAMQTLESGRRPLGWKVQSPGYLSCGLWVRGTIREDQSRATTPSLTAFPAPRSKSRTV